MDNPITEEFLGNSYNRYGRPEDLRELPLMMEPVNSWEELKSPGEGSDFAMAMDLGRSVDGDCYSFIYERGKWSKYSIQMAFLPPKHSPMFSDAEIFGLQKLIWPRNYDPYFQREIAAFARSLLAAAEARR